MSDLELDPGDAQAWNAKGEDMLRRRKEPTDCIERPLKPTGPQDWAWKIMNWYWDSDWNWMGSAVCSVDGVMKAPPCFERALELDPCCARAWNNMGVAVDDLRDLDESLGIASSDQPRVKAIVCYERCLEIDPRYAPAWHNKGYALFGLGRHDEALACYDRALEIDPCYALAWYNKGAALYCLLRYEEALACFERRLELDPRDALAWYNKSTALYARGRRKEAREARKTAERLRKESRRR
jgi:tetratricopeptide (TPR) repeat protein